MKVKTVFRVMNVLALIIWLICCALVAFVSFIRIEPYIGDPNVTYIVSAIVTVLAGWLLFPKELLFPPLSRMSPEEREKFYRIM